MPSAPDAHAVDALLVIDMQNSFCRADGVMYAPTGAPLFAIHRVVTKTAAVVAAARDAQVPVVFTRHQFQPNHADFGPLFPQYLELLRAKKGLLARTPDADLIDELEVGAGDFVIDKSRLDAFYNTSLDTLLRSLGANRLAVAGVITNACVETSTRSAAMRDYQVTVLADCTTAFEADHRDRALELLATYDIAAVQPSADGLFVS